MFIISLTFRGPCIVSIFLLIYFQQDATFIYFLKSTLRVSGGTSTHHQEHTTVFTVSGTYKTVAATCRYGVRVGTGLSVVWELY